MMIQYITHEENPFAIPPGQLQPVFQNRWDVIMGDIPAEITPQSPVYRLVGGIYIIFNNSLILFRLCNVWLTHGVTP